MKPDAFAQQVDCDFGLCFANTKMLCIVKSKRRLGRAMTDNRQCDRHHSRCSGTYATITTVGVYLYIVVAFKSL